MFTIGNFGIKWYSVTLLIGAIVGFLVLVKEGRRFNFNTNFLFNLFFWCLIMGFIGARTYYVIFNFELYQDDLVSIFKVWEGGLAIHGGLIAGFLTMVLYCKKYNARLFKLTDMAILPVLLGQAIGRWGNFFNQEAYGRIIDIKTLQNMHLPNFIVNGMYIDGKYREPTFLYESLLSLIGFISLLTIRMKTKIKTGQLTGIYFLWYGVERFIIETLRSDSLMLFNIKVAQLISILFVIAGTIIIYINRNNKLYKITHFKGE